MVSPLRWWVWSAWRVRVAPNLPALPSGGDPHPPRPARPVGVERRRSVAGPGRPAAQRPRRGPGGGRGRLRRGRRRATRSTPPTSSGRATPRELVGVRLGLASVVDERLRERHAGGWEGRTRAEIDEGWPGYLESGRRPAGYEPDDSVLARVLDALERDRGRARRRCPRGHARGGGADRRAPPRGRRRRPDPEPGWSVAPTTTAPASSSAIASSCSIPTRSPAPSRSETKRSRARRAGRRSGVDRRV